MEKNKILSFVRGDRVKDYSYVIAFFLIFSFFIAVLIKPNVVEIFSSFERIRQMQIVDAFYEKEIGKSLVLQQSMEAIASKTYLLDEAIATRPRVNKLLDDLKSSFDKNNVRVDSLSINDINLKDSSEKKKTKVVQVTFSITGDFPRISGFVSDITRQRRLKVIKNLEINKFQDKISTQAGTLKATMIIEGYYL